MEIKKGDYVTRNSYQNDTIFKVINIKGNICYLKGVDVRLYADSEIDDLVLSEISLKEEEGLNINIDEEGMIRSDYFYLPGKILHLDADIHLSNNFEIPYIIRKKQNYSFKKITNLIKK